MDKPGLEIPGSTLIVVLLISLAFWTLVYEIAKWLL
jgi:hypothetical protein